MRRVKILTQTEVCATSFLASYQTNRPKVVREISVKQICVRHCEITFHAPTGAPGVSDNEPAIFVVVTDSHHCVATQQMLLLRIGH